MAEIERLDLGLDVVRLEADEWRRYAWVHIYIVRDHDFSNSTKERLLKYVIEYYKERPEFSRTIYKTWLLNIGTGSFNFFVYKSDLENVSVDLKPMLREAMLVEAGRERQTMANSYSYCGLMLHEAGLSFKEYRELVKRG